MTLTLQQPKLSFFFAENQQFVGQLRVLDIRLSQEGIQKMEASYTVLEENDICRCLLSRNSFAHKGQMGNALLVAGSYCMAGAAILAAKACLRSGVGKLTINSPKRNIPIIQQTVQACEVMSEEKVGALIVFGRTSHLDEYYKTGTLLDAQVSEQLIRNIFFPKASLHDGAMIIQNDRITAAGCVLPLSESERLHADLGTRHRAGVGMSEATDAVVVIVSKETGVISVAVGGILKRHLAPKTLERLLRNELCHEQAQQNENLVVKLRQKLHINDKGGKQK
jgi:hypothetical protein